MAMEPQEKRQSPRVEVQLAVDLRTKYIYTAASVLNISRTGMFIKTQNPLPEGSEVEIILHSAHRKKPKHFKGIVCWERKATNGSAVPPGMGVKLVGPNGGLLDSWVRELKRTPKNY